MNTSIDLIDIAVKKWLAKRYHGKKVNGHNLLHKVADGMYKIRDKVIQLNLINSKLFGNLIF